MIVFVYIMRLLMFNGYNDNEDTILFNLIDINDYYNILVLLFNLSIIYSLNNVKFILSIY